MTDEQLLRYSRHILLEELGIEGQQRLLASHAVIVGAGGLGSPAALYLASAGVGRITLVDPDVVDLTNLQRQIAHTTPRIGQLKVESARSALQALNPDVRVEINAERADEARLDALLPGASVVLDCSDNFATRHALNRASRRHRVPLVSGAAIRFDGQITVFDPRMPDSPCYACLFPPEHPPEDVRCATMGVFAPLVGIIGTLQAAEAIKLMAGLPETLMGRLLLLDGRSSQFQEIRLTRRPDCPVCASQTAP
ncbi:Molybdopterin-synthase adenylyltransferase [Tepidimonas alkaliphilus]|uniref:Molybdopterin-synthase adenylyltransferase n=1 Tax=Tepidimonas alkaliphilus TaxID=2588942 RepID=A0A554W607_9BURK|nr:molybdopterin-synthase adenylyltransferase MoeB [Tepidimonas alkaliphilus]TSE19021.1 Molybdopterin-synthase adenylyltransferase [Tepidimonas alkaliphilus]